MTHRVDAHDNRYRSVLQKSVRRGNTDLVFTLGALMSHRGPKGRLWLRDRTANLVMAESWPLSAELVAERTVVSRLAVLIRTAQSKADRDAAGLGYLALSLFSGDRTVLSGDEGDRTLRILAEAQRRPADFWEWAGRQPLSDQGRLILRHAYRCSRSGPRRTLALAQATAFLAMAAPSPPAPEPAPPNTSAFPYWVIFDRHTREGRRVCRNLARSLKLDVGLLEWLIAVNAGLVANGTAASEWWRRFTAWRYRRVGLDPAEADLIWDPVKPLLIKALAEESRQLHGEIYLWKQANQERIDALKDQVGRYQSQVRAFQVEQQPLF